MVCSFYTLVKLDWLSHGVFILHAGETRLAEPWCVHSTRHGVFILTLVTRLAEPWCVHSTRGETRLAEPWCVHSTR